MPSCEAQQAIDGGRREVQRAITIGETNKLTSTFGIQDGNSLIAYCLERGLHVNREILSLSPDYEDKREPRFFLHQPAEEGKESPRRGDVRQPLLGSNIEDVEFVEKNDRADVVTKPLEEQREELGSKGFPCRCKVSFVWLRHVEFRSNRRSQFVEDGAQRFPSTIHQIEVDETERRKGEHVTQAQEN